MSGLKERPADVDEGLTPSGKNHMESHIYDVRWHLIGNGPTASTWGPKTGCLSQQLNPLLGWTQLEVEEDV